MITDIRPVTTLAIAATPIVSDAGPPVVLSQTGPRGATGQAASAEPWGPWDVKEITREHATKMSRWIAGAIWNPGSDELIGVEIQGTGHIMSKGSRLVRRKSQDGGTTWRQQKSIFGRADTPFIRAGAFYRVPSTGRILGMLTTGNDGSRRAWAARSDDALDTVTWADVTASFPAETFVYSRMQALPAAAGGHDTLGAIVTSYGGAVPYIRGLYTQDAGLTWAQKTLKTSTGLPAGAPQEAWLVQIADGRWLLGCRTNQNTDLFIAVAPADMSAFGPWINSGIPLGSNVTDALVDGDYLHLQVWYRDGFPGSVEDNTLVAYKVLGSDVADDPTILGSATGRVMLTLPDRGISYPQSVQRELADGRKGGWYHLYVGGQDPSTSEGAGASLMVARQEPGGVASAGASGLTPRQHIRNPLFHHWPRGTIWAAQTAAHGGPGRWRINPSTTTGKGLTTSRVAVPDAVQYAQPFRSPYALRLRHADGAHLENFVGASQRFLGRDAVMKAADMLDRQRLVLPIHGFGPWMANMRATILVNGVSAIRTGVSQAVPVPQGIDGDGPWMTEIELATKSLTDLSLSSWDDVTSLDVGIDNNSTAAYVDLTLTAMHLYEGLAPLEPPMADDEAEVARYAQRIAVGSGKVLPNGLARSTSVAWIPLTYIQKAGPPTITVSDPTHFQVRNSADISVTAAAPQSTGEESAILALTVAAGALTLAAPQNAVTVDTAAWVQIDTGY